MPHPKRIKLINCDESILNSIINGNNALSSTLKINIPEKWTEFGQEIFESSLQEIIRNPESKIWWTYLPVDVETNTLIGSCGFKGEPINGKVEIGYEVAELFRNKGYATEIVHILTEVAFNDKEVEKIVAQTVTDNLPSIKVLNKCDFKIVREFNDEEDGQLFEFEKKR